VSITVASCQCANNILTRKNKQTKSLTHRDRQAAIVVDTLII